MMAINEPSFISYLTLGAAVVGASGTLLNWWHERSKNDELFDVTMEWVFGHDYYGQPDFYPTIIIHNRSRDSIAISDISLCWGWSIRRRIRYTALDYEDPEDLAFPYVVPVGEFWKGRIANHNFVEALSRAKFARIAWLVRRSSLWIRVETMRGNTRHANAMRMIEHRNMPNWLKEKGE